jgi:hypothetical protein
MGPGSRGAGSRPADGGESVTITGYLTIVSFDLKEGEQRRAIIEAARRLDLRIDIPNSEQFHVYIGESMDAYRLGLETGICLRERGVI